MTTTTVKITYFNVDFRVHLAQVVHDTVQVKLSSSQDNVFSWLFHLERMPELYFKESC